MGVILRMHERLNHIVPAPVYGLVSPFNTYESIVWQDPRMLPTEAALLAITDAQLDQAIKDADVANAGKALDGDKWERFMFEIHFDMENRMRAREGKVAITRLQYKNALLDVYRTL